MISKEQNERLTSVSKNSPMGDYMRRYWHPIAGQSELDENPIKAVTILGEDLVLFKNKSGDYGLIDRHCPHRRADMMHGIVEPDGLRCSYHGWCFDRSGHCISQPFEDTVRRTAAADKGRGNVRTTAYPVEAKAGMIWAYMGPEPKPLIPDWEPFSWDNGFVQVSISEIPCNWFQCQENSIDPVHFEWMHDNWGMRLKGDDTSPYSPAHTRLNFHEFDNGFQYQRIRSNTDEDSDYWKIGRVFLWPNMFFLGTHFEWRVPIDDENTLSILWMFTRVAKEQEPYVQDVIPTWRGPVVDDEGEWINTHVLNQDFIAWVGQGRIADRTKENLGLSDKGIVLIRRRFFDELEKMKTDVDPKATFRDPLKDKAVSLPIMDRERYLKSYTKAELEADLRLLRSRTYVLQAGQPDHIREAQSRAMGISLPKA